MPDWRAAYGVSAGYDELRRRGLPRGSGGIESADKIICHVRLKHPARGGRSEWERDVSLRCPIYNGTVDQIFADYMAAHGLKHTALRTNAGTLPVWPAFGKRWLLEGWNCLACVVVMIGGG